MHDITDPNPSVPEVPLATHVNGPKVQAATRRALRRAGLDDEAAQLFPDGDELASGKCGDEKDDGCEGRGCSGRANGRYNHRIRSSPCA